MRRRVLVLTLALLGSSLANARPQGEPGGVPQVVPQADPRQAPSSRPPEEPEEAASRTRPAVEMPTLLVLELEPLEVNEGQTRVINQLVTETYSRRQDLKVISASDIQKLIELEATRSSLGCDDMTCLSEIAGALGARYVVFGTVGRLGELLVVNLNVFDADRAEAVQRHTIRTRAIEELPRKLEAAVLGIEPPVTDTPPAAEGPGPLLLAGGGAAAAGALLVVGAGLGAVFIDGTLGDPTAKSGDKGLALSLTPWAAGAALGGAALLVAGAVAAGVEVFE